MAKKTTQTETPTPPSPPPTIYKLERGEGGKLARGELYRAAQLAMADGAKTNKEITAWINEKFGEEVTEPSVYQAVRTAKGGGSSSPRANKDIPPSPDMLRYVRENVTNLAEVLEAFEQVRTVADHVASGVGSGFDRLYACLLVLDREAKLDEELGSIEADSAAALARLIATDPAAAIAYLNAKSK